MMKFEYGVWWAPLVLVALTAAACGPTEAPDRDDETARPNLIIVLADQLRYQSVGYAGDAKAYTPNIDRLAQQGINFSNFVSSTPVCAATRATLWTGKYASTTGMVVNELRINPNHDGLGHVLSSAGYQTDYIGKWQVHFGQLRRVAEGKWMERFTGPRLGTLFEHAPAEIQALRPRRWHRHTFHRALAFGYQAARAHRHGIRLPYHRPHADRTESEDLSRRFPERVEDLAQKWRRWAETAGVLPYPEELGEPRNLWPPTPWPESGKEPR